MVKRLVEIRNKDEYIEFIYVTSTNMRESLFASAFDLALAFSLEQFLNMNDIDYSDFDLSTGKRIFNTKNYELNCEACGGLLW